MAKRPNFLLITSDQQRGDCYGFAERNMKTPHLDRLAADGAWLKNCVTANLVCQPSRGSILTGMLPMTHGAIDNGFDLPLESADKGFAATLARAGYDTSFIGKPHLSSRRTLTPTGRAECQTSSKDFGEDWFGPYMGFEHAEIMVHGHFHKLREPLRPPAGQHFERWFFSRGREEGEALKLWEEELADGIDAPKTWHSMLPVAWHTSTWVADRTIERIRAQSEDTPFVIWASFPDPHYSFDCPVPWSLLHPIDEVDVSTTHERSFEGRPWWHQASLETKPKIQDPTELKWRTEGSRTPPMGPRELAKMTANYYGMISLIDHNVGRILDALQDRGFDEETLVIYTSDHGDLLGDHGLYQKGPTPYESLLTVRAIARGPGISAGQTVAEPASTMDLAATFYDYAGVSAPTDIQSQSLRPLFDGKPGASRDNSYSEWRLMPFRTGIELDMRTVRTKRHKLTIDLLSGAGELYDLEDDPLEMSNRFDDPGMAAVQKELTEMIAERPGPMLEDFGEATAPGGS